MKGKTGDKLFIPVLELDGVMAQKKQVERDELRNAEKRFNELVEKRDELNAQARAAFEERNTLNDEKRKYYDELNQLSEQRTKMSDELNQHKRLRAEYQGAAKQLIESKNTKRKGVHKNLPGDIGALKADIRLLEMKQETTPLSIEKERAVLDEIKTKMAEVARLEELHGKQTVVVGELEDLDKTIDELFAKGEEEHQMVLAIGKEFGELKKKVNALRKEISHLASEATKRHEEGTAIRAEATKYHQKAMEMREKILAVRREKRAERDARRKEVADYNKAVRSHLGTEKDKEKAADKALEELMKGGKIEMG